MFARPCLCVIVSLCACVMRVCVHMCPLERFGRFALAHIFVSFVIMLSLSGLALLGEFEVVMMKVTLCLRCARPESQCCCYWGQFDDPPVPDHRPQQQQQQRQQG